MLGEETEPLVGDGGTLDFERKYSIEVGFSPPFLLYTNPNFILSFRGNLEFVNSLIP